LKNYIYNEGRNVVRNLEILLEHRVSEMFYNALKYRENNYFARSFGCVKKPRVNSRGRY